MLFLKVGILKFLCCVLDLTGNALSLNLNLSDITTHLANKGFQSLFQSFLLHGQLPSFSSLEPINFNAVWIMLCLCCYIAGAYFQ